MVLVVSGVPLQEANGSFEGPQLAAMAGEVPAQSGTFTFTFTFAAQAHGMVENMVGPTSTTPVHPNLV